jgi:sigma-B regulation protein RsbU (phosphoserine phosphatase)
MLNQPSPNFSHAANNNKWQAFLNLADLLSTDFSLNSLLVCLVQVLELDFSCKVRIWLDPSLFDLISNDGVDATNGIILEPSPLMENVHKEGRILSNLGDNPIDGDNQGELVIPLMAKGRSMGVIELDFESQGIISPQSLEFIIAYISQFSLALNYLQQTSHSQYARKSNSQLRSCEEICRSISSNLDRDSLVNNLLSLLLKKINCSRVNLFIMRGDDKKVLKKIGISTDGIASEKAYYFSHASKPVSWCISTQELVIINNINFCLNFSPTDLDNDMQSEIVIPLVNGESFVGIIELCSASEDEFGPDTLRGFNILSQYISSAIRNANFYYLEQSKRELCDRLHAKIGTISSQVSLEDLLHVLLDELEKIIPYDSVGIWLIDRVAGGEGIGQHSSLVRLADFRIKEQSTTETEQTILQNTLELFDNYFYNPIGEDDLLSIYPWLSEILNSKVPVIRNSPIQYEPFGSILGFNSDYSAIGSPLFVDDQTIGFVVMTSRLPDQFDFETRKLTSAFARIASIAIENSKLYTAAHDQAWISTVLLQVADAMQSITNLDELLQTIVNMLPSLIGVEACAIFLWDEPTEVFIPRASHGFVEEQAARLDTWEILPGSVMAFDDLKQNTKPVILDNVSVPDEITTQVFPNYDFDKNLMILFPLTSQTSLCGAILFDFANSNLAKDSAQEIWDETYTLIEGAARQTAVAIENLQLIKSQEEEAYTSIALLQVAQAIVSFNQLDEILSSIVRITPILVGVKRCIIYLWDSKESVFKQSEYYGFSKNEVILLGQEIKANEFPFIESIQHANQILYHLLGPDDSPVRWSEFNPGDFQILESMISKDEDGISLILEGKSIITRDRLLIGFPLSVKSEVLGVMLIEEEDPIRGSHSVHIRQRRLEIVKGITQQAAIAIKNEVLQLEAVKSERMEQELRLAREIQTTFLPNNLPELPGWDIGVRWQPARQVAGDFYDLLILGDDLIGFVIADVADKGMPAALFMTLIRTLIRAAARDHTSPAAVLKQVNELLIPDSKHGMFVTVFYGVFSVNSGMLVYANAGHNPPLVKHRNKEGLVELTRTTIALGLFEDIVVDERELEINPGDWLLLYTDGVTEAFSANEEMYGTKRLFALLENYFVISSNELLNRVQESVNNFISGVDLSDDITMAAIIRKPLVESEK